MNDVVGVVVGPSSIKAALLRAGATIWADTRSIDIDDQLPKILRELLSTLPRRGRRRVRLGVLVERPLSQVRRMEGLPPLDRRLTARLVRENAAALFLKREGGVVIASIHCLDDVVWGAALDRDVVDAIIAGARELRFDLRGIAVSSEFLNQAADVATAAGVDRRTPLVWTPDALADRNVARRRSLLILTAVAATLVLLASTAALARDVIHERRMLRELSAEANVEAEARRTIDDLRQLSKALEERATFDANRGRVTKLVTAMARALPESTGMLSLRVDSLQVNVVALSPRVTEMVPALGAVAQAQSVRIVGAVAHEMIDGRRLQRATFRFRRPLPRGR